MEDVQQLTPAPDEGYDSLFVPEVSDTSQHRDMSVPVAVMVTTPAPPPVFEPYPEQMLTLPSPILMPQKVESAEEVVLPFVQKLRDLEDQAKAEMTAWDSKYLGQIPEERTRSTSVGMKRKGTMAISKQFSHILLTLL
jgi:hypothetical protein